MFSQNETKSRLALKSLRAESPSQSKHPAKFSGNKFCREDIYLSRDLTLVKVGILLW